MEQRIFLAPKRGTPGGNVTALEAAALATGEVPTVDSLHKRDVLDPAALALPIRCRASFTFPIGKWAAKD